MGFRFSRRIKLIPGVRLNISKSGVSTSIGGRGATVNISKRGVRSTIGIPGTGLSYTSNSPSRHRVAPPRIDPEIASKGVDPNASMSPLRRLGWALFLFMIVGAAGGIIEMLSR